MTLFSKTLLVASGWLCASSTPALAQPAAAEGNNDPSNTIVIRAERSLEERFAASGSRVIVNRQDIENMSAPTVTEVLKQLPGVQVTGEGTGSPIISMRGMNAANTQILIDGERTTQGRRSAQLPLDQLPSQMIERIEVIRAPSAEFRGASAGTINIVLRQSALRKETTLHLQNQSIWGQNGGGGFFSRTGPMREADPLNPLDKPWTYFIGAYATEHLFGSDATTTQSGLGSAVPNAPSQRTSFTQSRIRSKEGAIFPRFNGRLSNGDTLGIGMRLSAGESVGSINGTTSGTNSLGITRGTVSGMPKSNHAFASLRLDHGRRLRGAKLDSALSAQSSNENLSQPQVQSDVSGGVDTLSNSTFNDSRHERALTLSTKLTSTEGENVWMLGAERENRRFDVLAQSVGIDGNTDLTLATNFVRNALWGQNDWAFNWSEKTKSTLTAGLRYEWMGLDNAYNTPSGSRALQHSQWAVTQPSLHLRTPLDAQTQWRLNLSKIARNPAFTDLVDRTVPAQGVNAASNPDTSGNPLLRSESTIALDLGMERRLGQTAGQGGQMGSMGSMGANLFVRNTSDVMAQSTSYNSTTGRWISTPQNMGTATAWGLEMDAKTSLRALGLSRVGSDWRLLANATLLKSRMHDEAFAGARIPGQARYLMSLTISKPLKRTGGWYGGGTLNLTGSSDYVTSTSNTASGITSGGYNKGYETLDVFLGKVEPKLGFWRLGINNLTNATRTSVRTNDFANYALVQTTDTSLSRRLFLMMGTQF